MIRPLAASLLSVGLIGSAHAAGQVPAETDRMVPSAGLSGAFMIQLDPGITESGPVYHEGGGIIGPAGPRTEVRAWYSPAAARAKIQGDVWIEGVVQATGLVDNLVVMKSLDADLDHAALAAVRQWTFTPGRRQGGGPVAVAFLALVEFRLSSADAVAGQAAPAPEAPRLPAPVTLPDGRVMTRPPPGLTMPRVVRRVQPLYTQAAMRARIVGQVEIEVVILPDGTVGRTHVSRSLDPMYGLDELAEKAARQWRSNRPRQRYARRVERQGCSGVSSALTRVHLARTTRVTCVPSRSDP